MQNHCCNPSLYTKIMNINGDQRLMFFARFDIQVGQELTYNYRCAQFTRARVCVRACVHASVRSSQ